MKLSLLFVVLICFQGFIGCSETVSTYEMVNLRSAADGAENAANETEKEVEKIQNINKTIKNLPKEQ